LQVLYPLSYPFLNLLLAEIRRLAEWKGHILEDRHRIEERVVLKQVGNTAPVLFQFNLLHRVKGLPLIEDSALIRLQQPDDVLKKHTFAAPALAYDGRNLVLINL
jgi:hypothetical protein